MTTVAVGNAVVVITSLANFRARRGDIVESQLRSQNLLLALLLVPVRVGNLLREVIGSESVLGSVHRFCYPQIINSRVLGCRFFSHRSQALML